MAARGELFGESPRACPFVALEDDRDARADAPDPRHRCYAEPTPQPRALAHQEAFCLSPGFAGCPIFQDWAARAAARPVSAVAAASAAIEQLGVFDEPAPAADSVEAQAPAIGADEVEEVAQPQLSFAEVEGPAMAEARSPGADAAVSSSEAEAEAEMASADLELEPNAPLEAEDEIPAVPPFLAGRAGPDPGATYSSDVPTAPAPDVRRTALTEPVERPVEIPPPSPRSSMPLPIPSERVMREDVVPSWEIDDRYGAQRDSDPPEDRYGGWLTAIAVVAILALGVAGVIFLPGLLAGTPARSPTTGPTSIPTLVPSVSAPAATATDAIPSQVVTASPVASGPTAEPTVSATPRLYRIRAGDSLARIARRNDVTVQDILAANPEIQNPNQIRVGQIIVIPQPLPTAAP